MVRSHPTDGVPEGDVFLEQLATMDEHACRLVTRRMTEKVISLTRQTPLASFMYGWLQLGFPPARLG